MKIVKRTRLKFFTVMTVAVILMVASFCTLILTSTRSGLTAATNQLLADMVVSMEVPPSADDPASASRFNDSRGFTVRLNKNSEITAAQYNDTLYSEEEIESITGRILSEERSSGISGNMKYLMVNTQDSKILACVDITIENDIISSLLKTVIIAGSIGMVIMLILLWFLSYWIIQPTAEAFNKQKRFISEGGHELKTPLTVISAAVELMQNDPDSQNNKKLLRNIKEQTEKMAMMVAGLLSISRMDEVAMSNIRKRFNLSQTVLTEALAFESVAFENGKRLECNVEENLFYKGDVQAVRQAMGILCDNAIKHAIPKGIIRIQLQKQGKSLVLTVSNASNAIKREELPFLFERFFRGSESRSETKGAGLGLSILKSLADENGWVVEPIHAKKKIIFQMIL